MRRWTWQWMRRRLWRWAYSGLLLAAWPWVRVRLVWRARSEPAYGERVAERFGRTPADIPPGCVWFHAVSAGETIAAAPLVTALAAKFPQHAFLVTTMTPAGSAQVRARHPGRAYHCYAPYDFPWAVRRFYRAVRPKLLVLMETELWPNLMEEAAARSVPVLLVNARLSERSARGYARLGGLTRPMLRQLRWIACQYPAHAHRFEALGAPADRLIVHGSVKFDAAVPDDHAPRLASLRERWGFGDVPVWIAASTHPGEEAVALSVQQRLAARFPGLRLILVPRHPARAGEVARLAARHGFRLGWQSRPAAGDRSAEVIVGDTMGELAYLYGLADVAFVGGSLTRSGGHNPVEPAVWGVPAVVGPAVENFADVVAAFRAADAIALADDERVLGDVLERWLADPAQRRAAGERARQVVAANAGASRRLGELLAREIAMLSCGGG